mmetsp:Transcript_30284/g.45626  ORF Transcript_30284/g.45626 Transcript_30284/m.45626 type:complete len:85 (+) Transcript_30284:115-369(+)
MLQIPEDVVPFGIKKSNEMAVERNNNWSPGEGSRCTNSVLAKAESKETRVGAATPQLAAHGHEGVKATLGPEQKDVHTNRLVQR